jgi:hypothetical protein
MDERALLYYTDFSRLSPGDFGQPRSRGFSEYHYIPLEFTDGWRIVNNRGPDEWKVFEIEDQHVLDYLGYNAAAWTKDYVYPILCTGEPLWGDYSLEVQMTPLSRPEVADLAGVIFRYQDGRHYYYFGCDAGQKLILRYRDGEKGFRQDGWHELASREFAWKPGLSYRLRVDAFGTRIIGSVDGQQMLSIDDRRFSGGQVGLLACSPVRFHSVRVETTPDAAKAFEERRKMRELELQGLRQQNPKPVLWKRFPTTGFGAARALRLGDLNGDGRVDFLFAQSIPFFGSNYHQISCLTALDSSGKVLWQKGTPNPDHAYVSYDVAVQIHDINDDGLAEVIWAQDRQVQILEGRSGRRLRQFSVPESRIGPDETSWKEYQHYYRRDHLPWLDVDSISFADLRGTGKPLDILIKDRHTRLWAFTNEFEPLWTVSANLGHFPYFSDVDRDGKDEVYIGYSLFDHDGQLLWTLDGRLEEHSDGTCGGNFCGADGGDRVFFSASDDGVVVADLQGRILKHHRIGHAQTPSLGQFRPDTPGLEFCTINYWGEPGLITLFNTCSGDEIAHFELIHAGSPIMPVNWRGDGQEFILLSTNPDEGGMVDGWGHRVVLFPNDGHPDMSYLVHDLTGDPRDEVITWSPEWVYIYTQSQDAPDRRIYAPRRPPTCNESNYGPIVSWPQWVTVED